MPPPGTVPPFQGAIARIPAWEISRQGILIDPSMPSTRGPRITLPVVPVRIGSVTSLRSMTISSESPIGTGVNIAEKADRFSNAKFGSDICHHLSGDKLEPNLKIKNDQRP